MDLHSIVSGAIGSVNPFVNGTIMVSLGNSQNPNGDGSLLPQYRAEPQRSMQVQELSERDIQMLEGLNIQSVQKAIYIPGQVRGLVRQINKGGDLIKFSDGTTWLVVEVLEQWPDWVKVAVTMQNGS